MWDFGYLWQITGWPEDYNEAESAIVAKYFCNDLVRGPLRMAEGDDRVFIQSAQPIAVSKSREGKDGACGADSICFFGDALPMNFMGAKQFFFVESTREFIRIAERPEGAPIRFAPTAGPNAKLVGRLFQATSGIYAPTGSGPGTGAMNQFARNQF